MDDTGTLPWEPLYRLKAQSPGWDVLRRLLGYTEIQGRVTLGHIGEHHRSSEEVSKGAAQVCEQL